MTVAAASISGATAKVPVAGDVVTGMNITSSSGSGTNVSSVIFRATDFKIYNGTSGVVMFSVSGSDVNLAGTLTVSTSGKVYVGTNNGAGYIKRYPSSVDLGCLLCFDEKTGEFLWARPTTFQNVVSKIDGNGEVHRETDEEHAKRILGMVDMTAEEKAYAADDGDLADAGRHHLALHQQRGEFGVDQLLLIVAEIDRSQRQQRHRHDVEQQDPPGQRRIAPPRAAPPTQQRRRFVRRRPGGAAEDGDQAPERR